MTPVWSRRPPSAGRVEALGRSGAWCRISSGHWGPQHQLHVPGDCSGASAVAARAVGVLSSNSRSSSQGPRQAALVAGASGVHTTGCGVGCRCSCSGRGQLQTQTHEVVGAKARARAMANGRHASGCGDPARRCAPRVSLTLAMYLAAEAGERGQASGMQVHSQRDSSFLNELNSPRAIFVCGWLSNCGSEAGSLLLCPLGDVTPRDCILNLCQIESHAHNRNICVRRV